MAEKRPKLYGPPYISTWRWPLAMESIAALAGLEPGVLAPGHGRPMTGDVTRALRDLANG